MLCATVCPIPEKLVGVFTPNNQSLLGLTEVLRKVVEYRRASEDYRPLSIFPLPSRIENAEEALKNEWRAKYQHLFEDLFRDMFELSECDLSPYFDQVVLPHVPYYAYGENIAVLQERSDALSLSTAYEAILQELAPGLRLGAPYFQKSFHLILT